MKAPFHCVASSEQFSQELSFLNWLLPERLHEKVFAVAAGFPDMLQCRCCHCSDAAAPAAFCRCMQLD